MCARRSVGTGPDIWLAVGGGHTHFSAIKIVMTERILSRFTVFALILMGVFTFGLRVEAQMQLPGANFRNNPSAAPGASGGKPARSPSRSRDAPADYGKPVKLAPPSEDTLAGKNLMHNGRRGDIRFAKAATGLALTKIVLSGDVISKPGETCEVEVPGGPHIVRFTGFADGLRQYTADIAACPFTFTVLDGAMVVTHEKSSSSTGLGAGTCVFKEKDCRGYLAGFWGPSGRSFNKSNAAAIEKARAKSEKDARVNFRALLGAARGDRKRTSAVAADQAGFSARREERCRDFLREPVHGYCASRITEARAIQLGAKLNDMIKDRQQEAEAKKKERADARASRRKD